MPVFLRNVATVGIRGVFCRRAKEVKQTADRPPGLTPQCTLRTRKGRHLHRLLLDLLEGKPSKASPGLELGLLGKKILGSPLLLLWGRVEYLPTCTVVHSCVFFLNVAEV